MWVFFEKLQKKIITFESKINNTKKENTSFIDKIKNEILKEKEFKLEILYSQIIKRFKKTKDFEEFIQSLGYLNFDYIILKEFLLYFEIILINSFKGFDLPFENYVILLSFCILLCSNTSSSSYSKSSYYKFYIELLLFTIKSIFFKLYSNKYDKFYIQVFKYLINLIMFYIEHNPKNNYFLSYIKFEKKETEFKKFVNKLKLSSKNDDFIINYIQKN